MQTKHFLHLLDAELASCSEDLFDLEDLLKSRFETMEITHYVYMENDALLKREVAGVNRIRAHVQAIDPASFTDADELATGIRQAARTIIAEYQLPEAVLALVDRKIEAVRRFLAVAV